MAWDNADVTDFDENNNDRSKIDKGHPVPCKLCEHVFGRLRLTWVYCIQGNHGFRIGEHGQIVPNSRISKCILHWP
jgi:hypothetical protein